MCIRDRFYVLPYFGFTFAVTYYKQRILNLVVRIQKKIFQFGSRSQKKVTGKRLSLESEAFGELLTAMQFYFRNEPTSDTSCEPGTLMLYFDFVHRIATKT